MARTLHVHSLVRNGGSGTTDAEPRGDESLDLVATPEFKRDPTMSRIRAQAAAQDRAAQLLQGDELVNVPGRERRRIQVESVAVRKLVDLDGALLEPRLQEGPPLPLRFIERPQIAGKAFLALAVRLAKRKPTLPPASPTTQG